MRDINLIAVDLGASSGRIVSGEFTKNGPEIKEIFRFGNRPVHIAGGLYWDYMKLFQDIKYGLNMAENEVGALASFSVDTWGGRLRAAVALRRSGGCAPQLPRSAYDR